MKPKIIIWIIFAGLAILVGLYPISYFVADMSDAFLSTKSKELRANQLWNFSFYTHIIFGGIALLTGWIQFSKKLRAKKMKLHRSIGKIYVVSILFGGITGLHISLYASGGIATKLGFSTLSILWLITTTLAYNTIRKKKVEAHRAWMIRSYALTFAAVTLRLWMPILEATVPLEWGIEPYTIVSWLAWIPNLMFAQILIRNKIEH
jgi:uncharacterized membrane protein